MRLGVFGGSFDPVHLGHLAAAEEAAYRLELTRLLFVPARRQPLKISRPRAAEGHRLAMLEAAIAGNSLFEISRVELQRPAPSFTVETLRAFRQTYGVACDMFLLLGVDAVNTLDRWREPDEVIRLARIVVLSRGTVREPNWPMLRALSPDAERRIELLSAPAIDVSATNLRRRVAAGAPIRYQVPEPVRAYIVEHGLYMR